MSSFVSPGLPNGQSFLYNHIIFSTPKFNFMYKFTFRITLLLSVALIFASQLMAQTNTLGSGGYSQNFDTMRVIANATLPYGWRADAISTPTTVGAYSTASTTTTFIQGANMASNNSNGGVYNFGAGTSSIGNGDRAVGGMNTSNNPTSINVYVALTAATTLTDILVSYDLEKYRNGRNNDATGIQLYYSTTGAAGSWVAVTSGLTTFSPDANNDGFSPAPDASQTKSVTASFTLPAAITAGNTLYLAWNISVAPGSTGGNASNSPAIGIDNVRVIAASSAPGGLYYRSFRSGAWNDPNTWETSTTGGAPWTNSPGADYPHLIIDRTITVQTGHTVTITGNESADELMVNGNITITNPGTLSISDGPGFDITVIGGSVTGTGKLIMRSYDGGSSDVGTATLGSSTPGSITVRTIVERYLSAAFSRSAWRLLTAPLNTVSAGPVSSSIWANWQNSGNLIPGVGTAVSGPTYIAATGGVPGTPVSDANGLDYWTPAYSIRNYDPVTNSYPNSMGVADTKNTSLFGTKNNSFLVFINGDRTSYSPYTGGASSLRPTTLRPEGGLQVGDVTFTPSATPNYMTMVGNPYASHIDLDLFRLSNTDYIKSTYYYVDPYLTGTYGVGGYVTVSYDASGNELITPEAGGTTTSPVYETRYLQSGQAMFVQTKAVPTGTPVVTFTENQKAPTTVNYIMRTSGAAVDNLRVNLNVVSSAGATLIDGVVAAFNNNYAAAVDDYDAVKIYNVGESISFMRNNSVLSVERRPEITSNDVLNLNLTGLKSNVTYQFEIKPSLNAAGLNAFLVDNYLKTTTPVDLSKPTTVNFTINSDAASTGANRFYISFAKPALVIAGKEGISVFPNPVTNGTINLQMNNMAAGVYSIRVFNGVGQVILNRSINHAAGNSTETIQLGKGAVKGVYQLEVVKPDNSKFATKLIAN